EGLRSAKHLSHDRIDGVGCPLQAAHNVAKAAGHFVQVHEYLAALVAHASGRIFDSKAEIALGYPREGFFYLYGPFMYMLGRQAIALERSSFDGGLVRIAHDLVARVSMVSFSDFASQTASGRTGRVWGVD